MIPPKTFLELLNKNDINFFAGVPDSLLKDFCSCVEENTPKEKHIITANEGAAIGLATGHYLATGGIPLVYMQNSGLGNSINPLTSLADGEVYSIPMILMIGWRGEPNIPDEPQHKKMGRVTLDMLNVIGVPYIILSNESAEMEATIVNAKKMSVEMMCPVAIVVKKNIFSKYTTLQKEDSCILSLTREKALEVIIKKCSPTDITVSTTGKLSRELFELREKNNQSHNQDFLTVGSMGHASQIALGVSLESNRKVICLDGDGAIIMHMGSLATNGMYAPQNFLHIVFNNGCHESVGGQPTLGFNIDIPKIAKACGYKHAHVVDDEATLIEQLEKETLTSGPTLLEIRISKGSRDDLGRPTETPIENKNAFMKFIKK